ncbi:ABC transporter substrate-binding protein [Heyndrickxia shackletonii]|uniref:ABC transporter substrate-binding protein n=1 Tax=Heyndrickxia shackletonii TaxID=157838 RepID=A0A0Q3WTI0_9BACI|nr:basic amino acid ABC transporter substrate-binding protein [Heyndrickxia shackletonii]KQL51244.1 ABC transporter substrate-binding protein [Heyndrickxia shackletonii]MBB2478989.1 basic amino acid ABC transporter substrate-binding protein [Bacillus sp. APMAM]NEY98487.1 basic amino acid ABC transporter substrate-binding protein [Heyndrickxia shackletonii]RTZ57323.1 basic amino acid ABC transporter substrate-binding protein [Bacillus sp. SAJ1]
MKKYMLLFVVIITAVFMGACGQSKANGSNGDDSKKGKVLIMGTSADFPPFETRDTAGNVVGFDVDLGNYIAKKLGYKLEIKDMKFDGLIGALQSKRVDMVLSGMSATEERKKNVDFSTPYHHSGEMFVTKKGSSINTVDDLKGKTIGVQLGSIQEEGAKNLQKTVKFDTKAMDDSTTLIQELLSSRIQAAYLDKSVAEGYIKNQGLTGFDDPTTSSPGMGIAFPKGSNLVDKVDKILKEMQDNGKMDELKAKWIKK